VTTEGAFATVTVDGKGAAVLGTGRSVWTSSRQSLRLPDAPPLSSYAYRDHVPVGLVPLNADMAVAVGEGAGAGESASPPSWLVGLYCVKAEMAPLSGAEAPVSVM
jgi:hypothetical protein